MNKKMNVDGILTEPIVPFVFNGDSIDNESNMIHTLPLRALQLANSSVIDKDILKNIDTNCLSSYGYTNIGVLIDSVYNCILNESIFNLINILSVSRLNRICDMFYTIFELSDKKNTEQDYDMHSSIKTYIRRFLSGYNSFLKRSDMKLLFDNEVDYSNPEIKQLLDSYVANLNNNKYICSYYIACILLNYYCNIIENNINQRIVLIDDCNDKLFDYIRSIDPNGITICEPDLNLLKIKTSIWLKTQFSTLFQQSYFPILIHSISTIFDNATKTNTDIYHFTDLLFGESGILTDKSTINKMKDDYYDDGEIF